jgi:hypothetical protein
MSRILLAGAGFSRNWGGWLADEAFEYLLGCVDLTPQPSRLSRRSSLITKFREGVLGLKAALGLGLLLFCAEAATAASLHACWYSEGGCRSFIGKRLWVAIPPGNPNVVEVTFTQHDWTTERTLKLKSGASFVVKDVTKGNVGSDDYFVLLDDGRRGWTETSTPFLIDYDPVARSKQAAEECSRRGQPKIGMTPQELIASCWGKPAKVVKKTTAAGIEENYIYGLGHIVKFSDGKVSEIVEAR